MKTPSDKERANARGDCWVEVKVCTPDGATFRLNSALLMKSAEDIRNIMIRGTP